MINTRALTKPSPSDSVLQTTGDPLGNMLREGAYNSNRFYVNYARSGPMSNRTAQMFNSVGGYIKTSPSMLSANGLVTNYANEKGKQWIGDEFTAEPKPIRNALIYG